MYRLTLVFIKFGYGLKRWQTGNLVREYRKFKDREAENESATDLSDVVTALKRVDGTVKQNEEGLVKLHRTFTEVEAALSRMKSED